MLTRRNNRGAQQVAANGGMMDEAGQVVNGVEVPAGSLAEEVADDVPAMLSEGEFVVPADVVRYVGLERLMKMRDKAKEGLERMEEMGQMGNAEEVDNPDQQFDEMDDDNFENEIDSIMGEVDDEDVNMQTERMFAAGGYVTGSDLSKATQNPSVDVRYYKHDDGRVMYITHINEKPMTSVPDGFKEVSAEEARKVGKKAEEAAAVTSEDKKTVDNQTGGNYDMFKGVDGGGVGSRDPGKTKEGSSYVQYSVTPSVKDVITAALGVTTMNPALIASTINSILKTKQITTSPQYGKDVTTAASEVASGLAPLQGSPFGSVSEAKAIADYGFMSDQHFDAVIDAQSKALSPVNTGGFNMGTAASTGMATNAAGKTVSNDRTIAAQNEAMFGDSSSSSVGSVGNGGSSSRGGGSSSGGGGSSSGGGKSNSDGSTGPGDSSGRSSGGGIGADGMAKGGFVRPRKNSKKK